MMQLYSRRWMRTLATDKSLCILKTVIRLLFTCHVGTFRFKRMPFGLRNAPSTLQRAMDVILSGVRW
jgi:hypothetical protein